ncbi:hypothetical protein BSKO_04180 [Bryopsis sp. KO-2023]|nr:hypothetical protein BSKO_04180 [Bryopsis sp. KO-2023]
MSSGDGDSLLRDYVSALLDEQRKGNCPQYENFKQEFAQLLRQAAERREEPQKKLLNLVHALANSVGGIHEVHHRDLCEEIFGIKLQKYPIEIARGVIDVILNMAWADSSLAVGSLRSLVISLLPFDVPPKPSFDENGRWVPSEKTTELQEVLLEAVAKIVALSSNLPPYLVKLVESKVPFIYRPTDAHGLYMRVLSRLMSCPSMASEKDEVFGVAIAHLLAIDAEFGDELEKKENGADKKEGEEEDLLVHDEEFVLESVEQESMGEPGNVAAPQTQWDRLDIFRRRDARVTLDVIMDLWLDYFDQRKNAGQIKELWESVMSVFDARIVNTRRARCAPYLIFYLCIQDERCINDFVRHCLDGVLDARMPPSLRCSYVSYLASFLARCALLPTKAVVDCLVFLLDECERYARMVDQRDLHQGLWAVDHDASFDKTSMRSSQNVVFYSIIQGIMYVLCYRMQEVFGQKENSKTRLSTELRDLVERRLGALLHHSLDPLNFCGAAIAVQFAHQASVLGVLDCMDLIDVENLHRYGMKIDAFFPFDPYPLPHSSHFLRFDETYVKWKDRKMNVDMETVYNAGHDHDGSGDIRASKSGPKAIPRQRACVADEPMGEFQEFSFSAGLTPMSVGNG